MRSTGQTLAQCAALAVAAGATVQIYDRLEALTKLDMPNFALAGFAAPNNFTSEDCPLCKAGAPINSF